MYLVSTDNFKVKQTNDTKRVRVRWLLFGFFENKKIYLFLYFDDDDDDDDNFEEEN